MAKEKIRKIVGYISSDIANNYSLHEYENQEIIQSLDLYVHVHKHIDEFKSIDHYNNAVLNIESIINEPYFVYYEKDRNSLLYFKEIDEYVCAVVKLKLRKNKDNYVATMYPLNKEKVDKFRDKALIEKYRYKKDDTTLV